MRKLLVLLVMVLMLPLAARAEPAAEILATYNRFVAAQNARDIAAVRELLSDSPDFLWVSDGRAYWGREAMLERMGRFQTAPVWRVEPNFARARTVVLDDRTGYLHLPLELSIGPADNPSRIPFLVHVLCRLGDQGWRIAALFTTEDKPE